MELPAFIEPQDPGQPAPVIKYYADGITISQVTYFNHDQKVHRESGPAVIGWNEDGTKSYEWWRQKGKKHRIGGPAIIQWHNNGMQKSEAWWQQDCLHRDNAPAVMAWDEHGGDEWRQFYKWGKFIGPQDMSPTNWAIASLTN